MSHAATRHDDHSHDRHGNYYMNLQGVDSHLSFSEVLCGEQFGVFRSQRESMSDCTSSSVWNVNKAQPKQQSGDNKECH